MDVFNGLMQFSHLPFLVIPSVWGFFIFVEHCVQHVSLYYDSSALFLNGNGHLRAHHIVCEGGTIFPMCNTSRINKQNYYT